MTVIEWENIKHFTPEEFQCQHCGKNQIVIDFVKKLDDVRDKVSFPFKITSGYRCPEHNNNVSSTGLNGPHTTGRAADIHAPPEYARDLVRLLQVFPGIGFKLHGPVESRFIHIDELEYRSWTY